MAAADCVGYEDHFLCSICLDVFTDPVSTPCGHNFCKSCISKYWKVNLPYRCPMCREVFNRKPQLNVNTMISEKVAQFRHDEQKRVQQYEVDVTLDPDTANPRLVLSDDGKQVYYGNEWKNLPDNPQRFTLFACCYVLAKQSFSSGRFYFEVQVKGKTDWTLGVARESIDRKGLIRAGPRSGYWTISLIDGNDYFSDDDNDVCLSVKSGLQKVGVFVDYDEGLVSFYDVDSSALIYSFIGCCFNDKLLPFFSPYFNYEGNNSAPLIITPVDTE